MPDAIPKLLIVHMSLYNGGAERSLINFLTALPEGEYEIDLLLFRTEGVFLEELPKHIRLLETPEPIRTLYYNPNSRLPPAKGFGGARIKLIKLLGNALAAAGARGNQNLRRQKRWIYAYKRFIPKLAGEYDVAMAYFHGEISYYVMDKVNAKRKLAWVHNDYQKTGQSPKIDKKYFERFERVASISPICVEALKQAFPGLESKFTVIPNITSAAAVRALSREAEPPEFDKDFPVILSVGRLNAQKACDLSISAARALKERGVKFKWYWVGDGALKTELEALISANGLEREFRLLGARANPYPYMRACDVFVQNSRYEGKSIVLDEAKILCKPIIVTNYPTVADQIEADKEGIVVDMTADSVADGIQRALEDDGLRRRLTDYLSAREYDNVSSITAYRQFMRG